MYDGKEDIQLIKSNVIDKTDGAVLELGCGPGRVMLRLAKLIAEGRETTDIARQFVGIDLLQHYLEALHSTVTNDNILNKITPKFRLVHGDFCRFEQYFEPAEKFGAIILCNSAFLHVERKEERISLFRCVRNKLQETGIFFLEFSTTFQENWDWELKGKSKVDSHGREWNLYRRNVFDERNRKARRSFKFSNVENEHDVLVVDVTATPISDDELNELLNEANLKILKMESAFPEEKKIGKKGRGIFILGLAG